MQGGAIRNELYGFLQVGFQFALSILSIFQELYIEHKSVEGRVVADERHLQRGNCISF